jgi:hypothetical protein
MEKSLTPKGTEIYKLKRETLRSKVAIEIDHKKTKIIKNSPKIRNLPLILGSQDN